MLQVFRVEHKETKCGPFQTLSAFTQELATKTSRNQNLVSPGNDGLPLGHMPYGFVFGCLDLESLREWFLLGESAAENAQIGRTLAKMGFVLAEYLVEYGDYRVSKSRIQVAFDALICEEEGLVQYHDLLELFSGCEEPVCAH